MTCEQRKSFRVGTSMHLVAGAGDAKKVEDKLYIETDAIGRVGMLTNAIPTLITTLVDNNFFMVATLNAPAARELQDALRRLLAIADDAFTADVPFQFPPELDRIPAIIEQLQPFLGREKAVRVPFWNCVRALDDRRKKLGLVATLEAMVERATSMDPSPMVTLLQADSQGKLSVQEQSTLAALDAHLQSGSEAPPANLKECRPLFARVLSPAYEKLLKGLPRAMLNEQFEKIMDYTSYVDFRLRNHLWNERYLTTLTDGLYGFLLQFDHDLFYEQLNRVLHGRTPKATEVKAGHARYLAKERQREKRQKTKPGKRP